MHACGHDAHSRRVLGVASVLVPPPASSPGATSSSSSPPRSPWAADADGRRWRARRPRRRRGHRLPRDVDGAGRPRRAARRGPHVRGPLFTVTRAARVATARPPARATCSSPSPSSPASWARSSSTWPTTGRRARAARDARAGTAPNVVPSEATLRGTLRTFTAGSRRARSPTARAVRGDRRGLGCELELASGTTRPRS